MPPVDDRTPYRSYQKPNAANTLADDVARLRAALDAIDADIAPYTKVSVLCATTANSTLSGIQTIDGISASNGARVLVKNQTLPAENGIYIQNNSGAWTRAADMNTAASAANALVGVQSGTTNGGSIWINTFKSTDTLGTTAMSWLQIGASGVTTFSAGTTGLTPSTATAGAVTLAGTLAVANGGTGVTTSTGTGSVVLSASPTLTGTSTFRGSSSIRAENASTQDAVVLAGRSGGTSSYASTLTPTTLSAQRTATLPDQDGGVVVTKVVSSATTADLGASTFVSGVLTGYPYNAVASATTTDGSPVINIDTSTIQNGRTINVASIYVPAGLVVSAINSSTQLTLVSAVRTLNITGITGNGTTATLTYAAQTYAPFAVGAVITITGTGVPAYDTAQTVTACTTTSVQFSNTDVTTVGALGTVSQSITAGTANLGFRNVIAALNIDGLVVTNARVLVKDQRTMGGLVSAFAPVSNGIYVVTATGSTTTPWVLTRASDANTTANIASSRVIVQNGLYNGGKIFYTTFLISNLLDSQANFWYTPLQAAGYGTMTPSTGIGVDINISGTEIATNNPVSQLRFNNIMAKTVSAPSAVTHTEATTFYIQNAPIAGTNVSITDSWSLVLAGGNFRNDGTMSIGNMASSRGPIATFGTITGGSAYTDGTYLNVSLTGGRGSAATADITVLGGTVTAIVLNKEGAYYQAGDTLSATPVVGGFSNGTGSGFSVPVATVVNADVQIYTALPRIRLGSTSINAQAGGELGSILFHSSDPSVGAKGDKVKLKAVYESTLGGGWLQVHTAAASSEEKLAVEITGSNAVRLYNTAATFYHTVGASTATANRTITLADENCVINAGIPSGTKMLFQQTSAPTGWTKDLTHDNKALRVVTGTASSGGTSTFTSVFTSRTPGGTVANTTLTTAQMPFHQHTYNYKTATQQLNNGSGGLSSPLWTGDTSTAASGSAGSGSSHTHGFTGTAMDFAVQYVDLIIATKN